jgi:hypothetical protein
MGTEATARQRKWPPTLPVETSQAWIRKEESGGDVSERDPDWTPPQPLSPKGRLADSLCRQRARQDGWDRSQASSMSMNVCESCRPRGDDLERIAALVDFGQFRPDLE